MGRFGCIGTYASPPILNGPFWLCSWGNPQWAVLDGVLCPSPPILNGPFWLRVLVRGTTPRLDPATTLDCWGTQLRRLRTTIRAFRT